MFCLRVVLLSSPAVLSCPFSCCALVSLLLLCSCVPSPAVLCVHCPLLSLLNSHAPSSSARRRRTQLITPLPRALSLAHATSFHRLLFVWSHWIVLSPSPSNLSNELNSSGTYFLIRFLSFFSLSFSSVLHHWRSRLPVPSRKVAMAQRVPMPSIFLFIRVVSCPMLV